MGNYLIACPRGRVPVRRSKAALLQVEDVINFQRIFSAFAQRFARDSNSAVWEAAVYSWWFVCNNKWRQLQNIRRLIIDAQLKMYYALELPI